MINKNLIYFLFFLVFLCNCFPNGKSRRNQCKRGEFDINYNILRDRNIWCSFYLLTLNDPDNRKDPTGDNLNLALCLNAQQALDRCENETTLPIGFDDVK